jgi:DNA-binding NtrC family response regulator
MTSRVLLTMDDLEVAVRTNAALEAAGYATTMVSSLDDARGALRRANPDLVVLTGAVYEPPARHLAQMAHDAEISILALLEATDSAGPGVRDEHLHATALLSKPANPEEVVQTVGRLVARRQLQLRTGIAGESPAIQELLVKIEQMAPVSSTVLVQGESGTGKELVARAIHDLSPRRGKPFIAINCAALPETLLESELFGHEKGAFTGAAERRLGRFELADTGTIFLDEIGEIPASVQVKLLRVLETRTFFRVGGVAPIKVDVRVVAASNRSLRDSVELGSFRDDLYYRLSVLNLYLPPLRERRGDIPLLVRRFIREFVAAHDRPFQGLTPEAMHRLVEAPWPGNVRQLRNLIESMVVLAPGRKVEASDIPTDILQGPNRLVPMRLEGGNGQVGHQEVEFILRSIMDLRLQVEELRRRLDSEVPVGKMIEIPQLSGVTDFSTVEPIQQGEVVYRTGMTMADMERAAIEAALEEHSGNRRKAAEKLGIGERTLYRKIKAYKLD